MMNVEDIKKILPHRYPFLLVDRVEEIEEGKSITAYKNVSVNEPFFQGHFPERPIMPGVLVLEALAQAGAIVVLKMDEYKGKIPLFVGAERVKWRRQVVPGDKLVLNVEMTRLRGKMGVGKAEASVDGKTVCQAEIMFAIG